MDTETKAYLDGQIAHQDGWIKAALEEMETRLGRRINGVDEGIRQVRRELREMERRVSALEAAE